MCTREPPSDRSGRSKAEGGRRGQEERTGDPEEPVGDVVPFRYAEEPDAVVVSAKRSGGKSSTRSEASTALIQEGNRAPVAKATHSRYREGPVRPRVRQ